MVPHHWSQWFVMVLFRPGVLWVFIWKMAEVKGPSLTPRQGGALGKIRTRAGKGPPKEGRPAPFASALLDLPSNKLRAFFFQFVFMYSTALGGATHHAGMWLNPKS